MIRHIVTWKLAAEDEAGKTAAFELLRDTLEGLNGVVPGLLDLTVSRNIAYPEKNFDLALVAHYANLDDLEAYQVHPAHQAAAAIVVENVSARASIDFEV